MKIQTESGIDHGHIILNPVITIELSEKGSDYKGFSINIIWLIFGYGIGFMFNRKNQQS